MRSGIYQLRDGRELHLRSLSVTRTYDGMLTGNLKTNSKCILDMLHAQARQIRPPQSSLFVIVPEKLPLPSHMWTAELESQKAVRTNDPDFGSHLSVCWFSEDLYEDIDTAVASQLPFVDWDEHAADYDITFL